MKRSALTLCMLLWAAFGFSQELYVNTEPASNMATGSLGIRLENQGYFKPKYKNRTTLELMYGVNRNWMVHGSLYASDFYRTGQKLEGGSVYAKYRILSIDSVQRHFRLAAFGKAAINRNPVPNREIVLEGDNSGFQTGLVATQLLHRLALSASLSYLHALDNPDGNKPLVQDAIGYTLSSGYLLLPKTYTSYEQTNFNIYAELIGKVNPGRGENYMDVAPAVQFIFNSTLRVDLSYRTPLWGNMQRNTKNMYLVRLEYNLFNLFQ
jgi:hypothetical protein